MWLINVFTIKAYLSAKVERIIKSFRPLKPFEQIIRVLIKVSGTDGKILWLIEVYDIKH